MGLATALCPFFFIIDTSLPFAARIALASTAMATSGVSTALVGWCGHPYVTTIRTVADINDSKPEENDVPRIEGIQLETRTLALRPRFTTVFDSAFLVETKRPFAKWELAESLVLQRLSEVGSEVPTEETVAETMNAQGRVLGRWIVSWNEDGTKGVCRGEGKVQRFFNVHEELLPLSIR
ncbi:hypothetical protein DFH11DRAFT_1507821 [Phellopilus nigrolimitatus]|nr:hypothetical protein DFH11DRAFT_1507821 [Phellopilus nigrolimitatus]